MEYAIQIKDLKKEFKIYSRGEGFWNALKSLFSRKYTIKQALKGISFNIQPGEIVGFIGPNGAGKSTTIKALAGVLYPDSGEINVLGFVPFKDRVEYVKNIGVVLGQKSQLEWDLPPVDTYLLFRDLYEIPEKEFRERQEYMIKTMGAEEFVKRPVRDLSLGERMRCEIIASLLHNPKLVFLDEPTIGLDVLGKDKFRDFILKVAKRYKTTFIVTTHDMGDIERLCKRIIIINNGKIIYDGLIEDIKKKYMLHKHLKVDFNVLNKPFRMKGCTILEKRDYQMKIEVDVKEQPLKDVINYLLTNFDCADIMVEEMPIEEIIKRIYRKK